VKFQLLGTWSQAFITGVTGTTGLSLGRDEEQVT
jgi:hypothetical protein